VISAAGAHAPAALLFGETHMPRSIAEVNAIRGSHRSPSAEEELPGDGHDGFDPNQPRVPAGHSDGGQWTKTGAHGPASRREVELDDTDEEAGEAVDSYRLDGTLAEQGVVNRDGSRIHSQFSLDPRMAGWDERHTVTLPDGQQITFENNGDTQTIYDADGQPITASKWTSEGPVPHAMVQLARGKPGGGLFSRSAPGIGPGAGEASPSLLVLPGLLCSHGFPAKREEMARRYWHSRRGLSERRNRQ
jgi:hypothetical protein